MPANEAITTYEPGSDITGHCSAAVTGKRCVKISGNRQSGPGLSATAEGGNVQIAHADAAGRIFGVARYDGAIGAKVPVIRGAGKVVPILADGAIAAFAEVEVSTNGRVKTIAAGKAIGYAITAAADGADAEISLYA